MKYILLCLLPYFISHSFWLLHVIISLRDICTAVINNNYTTNIFGDYNKYCEYWKLPTENVQTAAGQVVDNSRYYNKRENRVFIDKINLII